MKPMTVFGVGPRWGALTLAYGAASTFVSLHYDILRMPAGWSGATTVAGAALVAVGLVLYAAAGRTILRGFPTGRLLTTGVYRLCRHPVYGSWIVVVIPGLALLLRTWLGLTTVVFGYLLLRILAREEEDYLLVKFGTPYSAYRRRTPFVLPFGILRRTAG